MGATGTRGVWEQPAADLSIYRADLGSSRRIELKSSYALSSFLCRGLPRSAIHWQGSFGQIPADPGIGDSRWGSSRNLSTQQNRLIRVRHLNSTVFQVVPQPDESGLWKATLLSQLLNCSCVAECLR